MSDVLDSFLASSAPSQRQGDVLDSFLGTSAAPAQQPATDEPGLGRV